MARIMRIDDVVFIDDKVMKKDKFISAVIEFFYLNDEITEKFIEFLGLI